MNPSKYFRISLTEKCNLDCYYCHKEGNFSTQNFLMTPKDLKFVCEIALQAGFRKFKLTGGEPTLRCDICEIITELSALNLPDLSMITNGTRLCELATDLKRAGLPRLNVTLNTLNPKRFEKIQRKKISENVLEKIINGIDAAQNVGFRNIKLNFVYFDEDSQKDLSELISFVKSRDCILVVLPVLQNLRYTLEYLYDLIKNFGIDDEEILTDAEGIRKKLIRLKNGARILLRIDELANKKPYIFCQDCTNKKICREGIFPIRLSAKGEIIPCMASFENRIDIFPLIKERNIVALKKTFEKINLWYRKNE